MGSAEAPRWRYTINGGEPPRTFLMLDDSEQSRELRELFEERQIPYTLGYRPGNAPDRPMLHLPDEGRHGRFIKGYSMIRMQFLSLFEPT